jgi:hypothetical protein
MAPTVDRPVPLGVTPAPLTFRSHAKSVHRNPNIDLLNGSAGCQPAFLTSRPPWQFRPSQAMPPIYLLTF